MEDGHIVCSEPKSRWSRETHSASERCWRTISDLLLDTRFWFIIWLVCIQKAFTITKISMILITQPHLGFWFAFQNFCCRIGRNTLVLCVRDANWSHHLTEIYVDILAILFSHLLVELQDTVGNLFSPLTLTQVFPFLGWVCGVSSRSTPRGISNTSTSDQQNSDCVLQGLNNTVLRYVLLQFFMYNASIRLSSLGQYLNT